MARGSTLLLFKPSDTLGCSALLEAGMEPSPHPVPLRLLHLFWLPLVVRIRQARRGGDSSLPDGLFGVPHSHKDIVKKGCTCWKKKVGTLMASSPEHQDLGEKHTEILHLDQEALFSHEHSLFSCQSQHTLGKWHTCPLL